jgi:hypothetical protein
MPGPPSHLVERLTIFFIAKPSGIFYDWFMKTIALSKNSIHSSLRRYRLLFISLLLVCFALLPRAQAVGPDTDGSIPGSNNGEGVGVLVSRPTGVWNTGTGFEALNHLTSGNQNTATGLRALFSDTNGGYNTATGVFSLYSNTSGFFNSATGAYSLAQNTSGSNNTANGYGALYYNTEGNQNTATGFAGLYPLSGPAIKRRNGPKRGGGGASRSRVISEEGEALIGLERHEVSLSICFCRFEGNHRNDRGASGKSLPHFTSPQFLCSLFGC